MRFDQIVDMSHPLLKLAATIDQVFQEQRFGAVNTYVAGRPFFQTCSMEALAIVKHLHGLFDDALCER